MMRISNTKSDLKTINETLVERKDVSLIYTLTLLIFEYLPLQNDSDFHSPHSP